MTLDQISENEAGWTDIHRILVVDDDPEHAQHVKSVLEKAGCEVTIAKDGGQAHGSARMHPPDFVILKLILPGESGFEICERMKQVDRNLPIMALTEMDLEAARNLATRIGVDGYLTKPYDDETLAQLVQNVAKAVWERIHVTAATERGRIRFRCRCGRKMSERLENRGKSVNCPECNERVMVPNNNFQEGLFVRSETVAAAPAAEKEPLRFVTIKCQHCDTFYKLFSTDLDKAKTCPRCRKEQTGSLSIVGAPLSRAALASSMRVLRIRTGKNKGKKLLLPEKEIAIGTDKSCHIRNSSHNLSPKHCSLHPTTNGVRVCDLGSESGTFVNGERVEEEALLTPGGILRIGSLQLQLVGKDRALEDLEAQVQKWSEAEEDSKRKGVKVFNQLKTTAAEAADVIELHWELCRKRAAGQSAAEPLVGSDSE